MTIFGEEAVWFKRNIWDLVLVIYYVVFHPAVFAVCEKWS
jgi:hypothetical protein